MVICSGWHRSEFRALLLLFLTKDQKFQLKVQRSQWEGCKGLCSEDLELPEVGEMVGVFVEPYQKLLLALCSE